MERRPKPPALTVQSKTAMRILLIGANVLQLRRLRRLLERHAYAVDIASDNFDGRRRAGVGAYAAILLDVIVSDPSRFAVLQAIRRISDTPVLVLTPRDSVEFRLLGFEAGASDFIVRPFAAADLVSRVRAMLSRAFAGKQRLLRIANLEMNLASMTCLRNGKSVALTPMEFALLAVFLRRPGQVLSRALLMREVWSIEPVDQANVIEVTVRRLRIKVDNPFEVKLLHTVRGVGYILQDRSELHQDTSGSPVNAIHRKSITLPMAAKVVSSDPARSVALDRVTLPPKPSSYSRTTTMDLWKRNNVWISGDGPATIIFAHGFGCDQSMWRLTAPFFRSRFRTILFDHVGSGGSDLSAYEPSKYSSLRGYGDDVNELLENFSQGPTIFVGHSVSAMIGMLADLEKPGRIIGHVMLSPSPCYVNDGEYVGGFERSEIDQLLMTLEQNYFGWSRAMAPAIMGAPDQPDLSKELTNSFCSVDPEIAKHFARTTFLADHRADLAQLSTPTLILQCDDDVIAPLSVGKYMHRILPKSTLQVIENIGHCPHLSTPNVCLKMTEDFLIQISDLSS